MAHKTLIGGTAYEIGGGKTLVGGTAYSIDKGKTLVGGTVHEVGFGSWPDDLDTGLEFVSASAFTLSVNTPAWDGTLEYSNGDGWKTWDGSEISSASGKNGQCIYIRGTGTTKIGSASSSTGFTLTGTNIACNGNVENLLDYATVKAGKHPEMADSCFRYVFAYNDNLITAPTLPATTMVSHCYANMFTHCNALTTVPALPATTMAPSCYYNMFAYCDNLITVPALPATTMANRCYSQIFMHCDKIKLSEVATETYTRAYRVPISGNGTDVENTGLYNMFKYTGGTFTGTPTINTTYYLDSSNSIV